MTLTISKCKLSKQQHTITLNYTLGENENNSLIFTLMIYRNFFAHRNAVCKTRDGLAHLIKPLLGFLKRYHKIPMLNLGLIFVQKAFLVSLFLGELIFGGAYYGKELKCVSKWVDLDNKNSLKHCENIPKQLALRVYGLIFGRAYMHYWKDFYV